VKASIFSNQNASIYHLRGYIETHSHLNLNWRYVSFPTRSEDMNRILACKDDNTFLCFSLTSIYDYYSFVESTHCIRRHGKRNFTLILGGPLLSFIDLDQFHILFPEVDYTVTGKGEKPLLHLIKNGTQVKDRMINGNEFGTIERYIPWVEHERQGHWVTSMAMNPDICPWNKCSFCHHTKNRYLIPLRPSELVAQMHHLYKKYNIRCFFIYDNCLTPNQIERLLDAIDKSGLNGKLIIEIFGVRISKELLRLRRIFEKTDVIRVVNWGLEFLSDTVLDLYNKGTDVGTIFTVVKEFKKWGVLTSGYFLYGLPMVSEKDLELHQKNYRRIQDYLDKTPTSWFLLTPGIEMFKKKARWQIQLLDRYSLADAFGSENSFNNLRTSFYNFKSANPDTGAVMSRWEDFLRYKRLLADSDSVRPIAIIHPELFFLARHRIYEHFLDNPWILREYPLLRILWATTRAHG
jgi:hypothetical protein